MKRRNIGLDIARVAAIILVWVNHSGVFALGMDPRFMEFGGVVCLEVFFALSGLLVGKSLILTVISSQPRVDMKNFYINRLIRTIPLYYLALLATRLVFGNPIPWTNFFFLQSFRAKDLDFFPPSWSLPVEAWFYFLIPPVFFLLNRFFSQKKDRKTAIYLSAALLWLIPFLLRTVHILVNDPVWDFGVRKQILLRMDALMLGVFFAAMKLFEPERYRKIAKHPLTPLTAIAGILALYGWYYVDLSVEDRFDHSAAGKMVIFTLLPLLCCLLVMYMENAQIWEKFRGTILEKLICGISSLGYSIYLVHYGVFHIIAPYVEGARFLVSWLGFLSAIAITLLISLITYKLIEEPLTKLKDKLVIKV